MAIDLIPSPLHSSTCHTCGHNFCEKTRPRPREAYAGGADTQAGQRDAAYAAPQAELIDGLGPGINIKVLVVYRSSSRNTNDIR